MSLIHDCLLAAEVMLAPFHRRVETGTACPWSTYRNGLRRELTVNLTIADVPHTLEIIRDGEHQQCHFWLHLPSGVKTPLEVHWLMWMNGRGKDAYCVFVNEKNEEVRVFWDGKILDEYLFVKPTSRKRRQPDDTDGPFGGRASSGLTGDW